jgi:glycosyltransferase involved in cell wall biosynthesis
MIGVIVPAHNEQALLAHCLTALAEASRHPELAGEAVHIVVVLDDCKDFSGAIARAHGAQTQKVKARNVGIARGAITRAACAITFARRMWMRTAIVTFTGRTWA